MITKGETKPTNDLECSICEDTITSCDDCSQWFMCGDDIHCDEDRGRHFCTDCMCDIE